VPDPNVRTLGAVHDMDGRRVPVGVDYDTVVILGYRLDRSETEELAQLIVAASWEAARQVPGT
jgi:hypothetical protein